MQRYYSYQITLDGKFSTVQMPSSGLIPADNTNITNDSVVTGIQLNAATSYAECCKYKKITSIDMPMVVPINDAINMILRPSVSDNCVEHKQPRICIMPSMIEQR